MTIDILCKVVDNYGDIGVVYRLAKALTEVGSALGADPDEGLSLRLHVDDLAAFRALCPEVDPTAEVQHIRGWTVLRWNCPAESRLHPRPRVVLECFACGRPERFEELLFDPTDPEIRTIVNVEHLTAEAWADDFHRLPSATRSGLVKKVFFMPGFTAGTGGLLIDRAFRVARDTWENLREEGNKGIGFQESARAELGNARRELAARLGLALPAGAEAAFWVPVFSYERDYSGIVADLATWADRPRTTASKPVGAARPLALVAAGRSQTCFMGAWEAAGRPFPALELPFLAQEDWDELLLASDFPIIRGEESLARAALSGRPFLWHAYLQEGGYQLVKVRALLERLHPYFAPDDYATVEELWLAFNDRVEESPRAGGAEPLLPVLERAEALVPGFSAFAADLSGLGDLAANLVTFIRRIV